MRVIAVPPSSRDFRATSPRHRAIRAGALAAGLLLLAASSMATAAVEAPAGTSESGIVPLLLTDGPGGNATCAEVPGLSGMSSSDRIEVKGNGLDGTLPDGLIATLSADKRSLAWTSTFAISAVIVKGGNASNVYVYDPAVLADAQLVAPQRPNGQAADVSNVTFCWDPDPNTDPDPEPPIDDPDLVALCLSEATNLDVGAIVSFTGPISIVEGDVVAATVPEGFVVTFDPMTEQVDFVAPFEVVVAVTAASDPVVNVIDPPSTSGSVPLASDPGDGEIVLCGLDTSVVVTASCAQVDADAELGPVPIRARSVDPSALPAEIVDIDLDTSIAFVATVPVVGVKVEASEPVLYAFEGPVLTGSIPVAIDEEAELDLTFCVLATTTVGSGGGSSVTSEPDPVTPAQAEAEAEAEAQDPTEIATGGGPSGRTLLSLFAFVVLALSGSSTMLLWSRGG